MMVAAYAMLVETESLCVNAEEFGLRVPVLTLTAHAIVEGARVKLAAAGVADTIEHAVSFGRKFFAQALFEVRSNTTGKTQHVQKSLRGSAFLGAFQQAGNVRRQSGDGWRDADADLNTRVRQFFHRRKPRSR